MFGKKSTKKTKFQDNRLFTLTEKYIPRLSPALAKEIGLNESILFLQIEFLIAISDHNHNGHKWTYQSITDFQKMFPFWCPATINRAIKSLQEQNLIYVGNFNKAKYDRTRWFAINCENAGRLNSIRFGNVQTEADSTQIEAGSTLEETTIPKTTTNTTSDISTDITTQNKGTLSASPSASSILETQSSINGGLGNNLGFPPPGNVQSPEPPIEAPSDPASEVFNDWREVMERPEAIFNKKTRTAVASRLKEGYSVTDLKLATRGILFSPWHMGKNDNKEIYDSLALICRDGNQVEKFKTFALTNRVTASDALQKHNYAMQEAINNPPRKEIHYLFTKTDANGNRIQSEPYEVEVGGPKVRRDFAEERI